MSVLFEIEMELSEVEQGRLAELETIIDRGQKVFVEVGLALAEIRDKKLFRETHKTFEEYCGEKWGFSSTRAKQLIDGAAVARNIETIVSTNIAESHMRPLTNLQPDLQREVYQEAVATAPNGRMTAAHVEDVARRFAAAIEVDEDGRPIYAPDAEEEEESEWVYTFDPSTQEAYCKYCYETHSDWDVSGDHSEPAWYCNKCEHVTVDRFMDIAPIGEWDKVYAPASFFGSHTEGTEQEPHKMAVHFSSESPEHYTPEHILSMVTEVMGRIDLDPCSNSKTDPHVPATHHYTVEDDGLSLPWCGSIFLNPPYGRVIGEWVTKLVGEFETGEVTQAIALVPARTDTGWWDRLTSCGCTIPVVCFVQGRLTFIGNDDPAPFPSALVYLGNNRTEFYSVFSSIGCVWTQWNDELAGLVDYG